MHAIEKELPELEVIYADDHKNVPYGSKQPQELLKLVLPILQDLQDQGCRIIVIACNTVTTTIIGSLRDQLNVPLVAIEPMIKPAAKLSKSGIIAVCATPATLASQRYGELKSRFGRGMRILEPDCSDWAEMIEKKTHDHEIIRRRIEEVCLRGVDVIVLGCTHYHWIEEEIQRIAAGKSIVLQPEKAVIDELKRVLGQLA